MCQYVGRHGDVVTTSVMGYDQTDDFGMVCFVPPTSSVCREPKQGRNAYWSYWKGARTHGHYYGTTTTVNSVVITILIIKIIIHCQQAGTRPTESDSGGPQNAPKYAF